MMGLAAAIQAKSENITMDVYELVGGKFIEEMSESYDEHPAHPHPLGDEPFGGMRNPIPAHIRVQCPKLLEFHNPHFVTTDYVQSTFLPTVSQRLRDIIESLEPGVHEFIPVEVRFSVDPERKCEPMYLISVALYETGLDIEKCPKDMVRPSTLPPGFEHLATKPYDPTPRPKLSVEKGRGKVFVEDEIRGRHLWKFHHEMALWQPEFASTELVEAVKKEGLIGPRFVLCRPD